MYKVLMLLLEAPLLETLLAMVGVGVDKADVVTNILTNETVIKVKMDARYNKVEDSLRR
jgi:hypothetical protein